MIIKLTETTVIGEHDISTERYRAYFKKTIEGFAPEVHCGEFQYWIDLLKGKTLGEAIESYRLSEPSKSIEARLSEERFNIINQPDKAFIVAFSHEIAKIGYDFGGHIGWGACWGRFMVIYPKDGVKGKPVIARVFIRDDGIILRMFFNNVDKHAQYIEHAPEHIKAVFTCTHGDCSCNPKKEPCKGRKTYTIDGRQFEKCAGVVFEFHKPNMAKLPDYMALLNEFYAKKARS